jgi:hypothetical protein
MANVEKKKAKLTERISLLENELRMSLQKKAAGPAINVAKYTTEIKQLRNQLESM